MKLRKKREIAAANGYETDAIVDLVYDSEKDDTRTAGANVTFIVPMEEDTEEDDGDENVAGEASSDKTTRADENEENPDS